VILRDADDPEDSWTDPSDSDLEMRLYYCQNWRADVAVVIHDSATLVERVMYSPYGVPFGIPCGDLVDSSFAQPSDGTVGGADQSKLLADWGSSHTIADLDNDGDVDGMDQANLLANWGTTLAWGAMSYTHNRFGYAGYVFDEALAGTKWHVRYRVLESVLGRWLSRDRLEYVDGLNLYEYARSCAISCADPFGTRTLDRQIKDCLANCDEKYLLGPLGPNQPLAPPELTRREWYANCQQKCLTKFDKRLADPQNWRCDDEAGWFNNYSCSKDCCIKHDLCYMLHGCSSRSWWPIGGNAENLKCFYCNLEAVACILGCSPNIVVAETVNVVVVEAPEVYGKTFYYGFVEFCGELGGYVPGNN